MALELTIEDLHKYNGIDSKEIYIACKNTIFDVSDAGIFSFRVL